MKRTLLFLPLFLVCFFVEAQVTFEEGYFIDNNNQRNNCLIKNIDWNNNPKGFKYKNLDRKEVQSIDVNEVKEFGIGKTTKFISTTVQIDRPTNLLSELSDKPNPEFQEEKLFLKVVIEGKATLYSYVEKQLVRYFYNVDNSKIEQLIFKVYKTKNQKSRRNDGYKRQLLEDFICQSVTSEKVTNLNFDINSLIDFFKEFNDCSNFKYVDYTIREKKNMFSLSARAGIQNAKLNMKHKSESFLNIDFDSQVGYRFGIDIQYTLRVNKYKWALFIQPTYQSYEASTEIGNTSLIPQSVTATYKSIEIPIGIRHFFYLPNNSKFFVSGMLVLDSTLESFIDFEINGDLDGGSRSNLGFGVGFNFKNKVNLELLYQTERDILKFPGDNYEGSYQSISATLAYTIF